MGFSCSKLTDLMPSIGRTLVVAVTLCIAATVSVPPPVCGQESDSCCTVEYSASFPRSGVWT